jgi:hypothetical protein
MKHFSTFLSLACFVAGMAIIFSACSKNSDNPVTPPTVYKLTVSLDPALSGAGTQKVTDLSKAVLYNGSGTLVKTATLNGGSALFELTSLTSGDYFIEINDLKDDWVPVRIASISKNITESVDLTLSNALILVGTDTMYRVKTYSKGQSAHPLVKYSDGNNTTTETYLYAIQSLKENPMRMEMNSMSTARMILLQVSTPAEPHVFKPWSLGSANHGITASTANCYCHGDLSYKSTSYSQILNTKGYCYKCHYGPDGPSQGFVDPTK